MVLSLALRRAAAAAPRAPRAFRAAWRPPRGAVAKRFCSGPASISFGEMLQERRNVFVHVGNVIFLLALNQTDMVNLRTLSITASFLGLAYNLLQPVPLYAPAIWGVLFIGSNTYNLAMILRERQKITLTGEQEKAYELAFMNHGFSPRMFLDILEATSARWYTVGKGEIIHKRGDSMDELTNLQEGEVKIFNDTDSQMMVKVTPGKSSWLGEFFDPNMNYDEYHSTTHTFPVSFKCVSEQCRLLSFKRKDLHYQLLSRKSMKEASTKAQVKDLWGKLHNSVPEARRGMYLSMLEMAVSNGNIDAEQKDLCKTFRDRHKISDEEHEHLLQDLGWTPLEFENGVLMRRQRMLSTIRDRLEDAS